MKERYKKISPIITLIVLILLGILFYKLNTIANFRSDDYNYHFSFANGTRISSLMDVVNSQKAHYSMMNGRMPAHFLMQLFTIYGKPIFNIFNAIVYMVYIILMSYMITKSWRLKPLTIIMLFIVMWFYTPAYGQTVLWMDGSFNYLWTATIVLIAFLPYRNPKLYDYKINQFIFPIIALIAGWCSETISAGLVFFQFWFILYWMYNKRKHVIPYVITMLMTFAGYCLMMFAPAQLKRLNNVSGGNISILRNLYHFIVVMANRYYIEIILLILLVSISAFLKRHKEINYMAILFFMTAVLSSCTLVAAGIEAISDRAFFGINTLIVISLSILVKNIFEGEQIYFNRMSAVYVLVLLPVFLISYRATYVDMVRTNKEFVKREAYIKSEKEKGEKEIHLKPITSKNDHNPFYLSPDISANPNHWQNTTKAKYYGVDKIILQNN